MVRAAAVAVHGGLSRGAAGRSTAWAGRRRAGRRRLSGGRRLSARSTQRGQALLSVEEVGREGRGTGEELPSTREVPCSFVEIPEGVPLPKMAGLRVTKRLLGRRQQSDRSFEVAAICQRPGYDESALDKNLPVDACLSKLVPDAQDCLVVPERTFAVGDDRMLVERAREIVKGAQLPDGLPPPAEPVERQAVELADRRHIRRQADEHPQLGEGLSVPVALVRTRRDRQPSLQACGPIRAERDLELVADLRGQAAILGTFAGAALTFGFTCAGDFGDGTPRAPRLGRGRLRARSLRRTPGATLSGSTARIGHEAEGYCSWRPFLRLTWQPG